MSEGKKKTYVSVVRAAFEQGKTNDEILAALASELPQMEAKKAKSKLGSTIKYLKTIASRPAKA